MRDPCSSSHWMHSDCLMTADFIKMFLIQTFFLEKTQACLCLCLGYSNMFTCSQTKPVIIIKCWCWMVLICGQASLKDWSSTKKWLCCRLRSTMLPQCTFSVCHVFVLVLCLSSAEDFDWTKNDHSSFYYGTFPAGKRGSFLRWDRCSTFLLFGKWPSE